MKEIIINSLKEYVTKVIDLYPIVDPNTLSEKVIYRGQSDSQWQMIPSIARDKDQTNRKLLSIERDIIESSQNKYPTIFGKIYNPINLLASLQHYGIYTRLLDVTINPLIALYFACEDEKYWDHEGAVFMLKVEEHSISNYALEKGIADTYRLISDNNVDTKAFLKRILSQNYSNEYKQYEIKFMEKLQKDIDDNKVIYVHAAEYFARQKNQCGRYLLFPNKVIDGKLISDELVTLKPMMLDYGKIVIPGKYKKRIIRELRVFGINKAFIYPDSIEKGCEEIMYDMQCKNNGKYAII